MQTNYSAKVLQGIGWLGASSLIQLGLRAGGMVVLARLIDPEAYGLIALATAVVSLVEIVTRLGIEPALIQRRDISDEVLCAAATVALLLGLLGMALLMVLSGPASQLLRGDSNLPKLIWLMAFGLPVNALMVVPRALLSRRASFRYLAVTDLIGYTVASFIVAIPLAAIGYGVWALAAAALAQPVITMILIGLRHTPFRSWNLKLSNLRDLLQFGIPLTTAKIANWAALQADNVIVGRVLGAAALGAYTRAYALNSLPATLLTQVVDRSLFPVLSNAQEDRAALQRAFMRGLVPLLVIFSPLTAYCFVYAENVIVLLLGDQWAHAAFPFQILSLSMYFRAAYKLPDITLRARGRTDLTMRLQIAYAFMVIAGALIGTRYGIAGVAGGIVAAIVVQYLQALSLALKVLSLRTLRMINFHFAGLALGALSYATFSWLAPLITRFLFQSVPYSSAILSVILLVGLYAVAASLSGLIFGEYGKWWRRTIRARFKRAASAGLSRDQYGHMR